MLSRTTGFAIRLAASLMLAGIGVYALAGTSGSVSNGAVVGTIEAVEGRAVLPEMGAKVVFSGSGGKEYTTTVDDYGRYQISLPTPDVYRATVWFAACKVSRAAFRLKPGERLNIRIVGINCATDDDSNGQMQPERNKLLPPEIPPLCTFSDELPVWYREETFDADPASHRPEVVISFGRCEENPKRVTYFSLDPSLLPGADPRVAGEQSLPVTITTEAFTLRADRVIRPGRGFTFYASGNVTVEDGRGHVTYAESATLSFANGHPVIKTQN